MSAILPQLRIRLYAVALFTCFFYFPLISTLHAAHNTDQVSSSKFELTIQDSDVAFTAFKSAHNNSKNVVLWLPSEHGLADSVFTTARNITKNKTDTEVWVADILGSLFLSSQASSINKVSDEFLHQLVKKVQIKSKKRIFIVSSGKGALLAMRASYHWLQDGLHSDQFGGLILLYPNFIIKTPEPGTTANYYPVTHAVNAPIFILQPENSPWRWQLATLQQHLLQANATPYIQILPKVRDRFFFRPDATELELTTTQNLAALIQNSIKYLSSSQKRYYATVTPKKLAQTKKTTPLKQQAKLRLYKKDPNPAALRLPTLNGATVSLQQYRGQVVIVNFWASWCPPCVHEMPSMEKLYLRYKKSNSDFKSKMTILAVNMAEDKNTINEFIQNKVKVSFPILLDLDGKALKQWQVFAFPSSFVIDRHGKIRYALFGSIRWDTPEVIEIINKLLQEPILIQ